MKILLAVDGSEFTQRMLDYLKAHTWLRAGNELTVMYAVPPVPHRAAAFLTSDMVQLYYADDAKLVLDPIRSALSQDAVPAEFVFKIGHPADEIANFAEHHRFDLVVMGSHGHGAVKSMVMGSVAAKVLAHCKVPLLLVR